MDPLSLALNDDPEVERIIALAQRHLDMDVAFVSQFTGGKQVFQAATGDTASFGIELQDGPALEATFCQRMVRKEIPQVIGVVAGNERVATLPATAEQQIGAYVGVPLQLADGEVYGTFCCLSHDPDPTLNERDGRFIAMLAELLSEKLQLAESRRWQRTQLADVARARDFTVALQPVVDVTTGQLVGAEALARFPERFGTPDIVFGQAHELGVGNALEVAAFREAHRLARLLPNSSYLAVNLSPTALLSREVAQAFAAVTDPGGCVIEVTENEFVGGYGSLSGALAPLRERGFRLAVDDVGAGRSSFHHVLELVPDIIKIDRSLVSGVHRDPARRTIMSGIVMLARDLGARVVAEGVEDDGELQVVIDLGVDAAQGYLLGRPSVDRSVIATWTGGWDLAKQARVAKASRRESFGAVLRQLRGARSQAEVLRAVNDRLADQGESARLSQGQYSAYEHGRQYPQPVRLRAFEFVFGLERGALDHTFTEGGGTGAGVSEVAEETGATIPARLVQSRRANPSNQPHPFGPAAG